MPRVGDKLIKLSIQMIVRHLNFITEKMIERKLRIKDVIAIMDDLKALQSGVTDELVPVIEAQLL